MEPPIFAQAAGMSDQHYDPLAFAQESLPEITLEVIQGARVVTYQIPHVDFLVGTVPGCDLRVPGVDLPPLICLLARHPAGLALRKLAPSSLLLLNGQTVSHAELNDGDRVTIGAIDIAVHMRTTSMPLEADDPSAQFKGQVEKFREQVIRLQEDRKAFDRLRREKDQEMAARLNDAPIRPNREVELIQREQDVERQNRELSTLRQELADIRTQLYDRYQERRDRLAALQTAVDNAARKVQERKRQLDVDEQQLKARRADDERQRQYVEKRHADAERLHDQLKEERRLFEESRTLSDQENDNKKGEVEAREQQLAQERADLEAKRRMYEGDVLRLDRLQGTLETRERELTEQARQNEVQAAAFLVEQSALQERARELETLREQIELGNAQLLAKKTEQAELEAQLTQRLAVVEGQQASLAGLRSRLERLKDEVRQEQEQIDYERQRQSEIEAEIDAERRELNRLKEALEMFGASQERQAEEIALRETTVSTASEELTQAQNRHRLLESEICIKSEELENRTANLIARESLLEQKSSELTENQERLEAELQSLRDRTQSLNQAEKAREALQEQLRRRAEELSAGQRTLDDKIREQENAAAALDQRRADVERQEKELAEEVARRREDIETQAASLARLQKELEEQVEHHRQQFAKLQDLGCEVADQRRALTDERAQLQDAHKAFNDTQAKGRAEFDEFRREAKELSRQLPDVELRAGAAMDRLAHAREQLRDHLGQLHDFVKQCQDEMEALRVRIQADAGTLQEREQTLRQSQQEHRLALAGFRQQLIGWQGQITEMKRLLNRDESLLEVRQAVVKEQVQEVTVASERVAREAEELVQERQVVAENRHEVERHLDDMRLWYQSKLGELTTGEANDTDVAPNAEVDDDGGEALVPTNRNILAMTAPADSELGQKLRSLGLIDEATEQSALAEARRQRRPLRQVILAAGKVSPYQLSLIESGQESQLNLGATRVLDRLRVTSHEAVYRVFDSQRSGEVILRQLAADEMKDAFHPDEFRQRFAQAMLADPHLVQVLEVCEIDGRPAVIEECVTGLPAGDWPPLAAAPGVCFRLLTQAALGLATAHRAGLVHGHLSESCILLTSEGILKIAGLGEPPWLVDIAEPAQNPADDLRALGQIVSSWCTPSGVRRGAKTKPLPEALVGVLFRLTSSGDKAYSSATELLEDLDRVGVEVPPNAEAWDRLVKYTRDHGSLDALLRQSA